MLDKLLELIDREQTNTLKLFQQKKLKRSEVDAILKATTNIKLDVIKLKRENQ